MPRKQKKYHYIYKTTCKVNKKFYVGMHSTDNLNDGYIGSGKRLWYSLNKHGKENHICEKLEFFKIRKKLKEKEIEIVNEDFINDPFCMNIMKGGEGGFISDEQQKKRASAGGKAAKLKRQKNSELLKKHKERASKIFKELHKIGKIKRVDWTGKKHKEESKRKIGEKNAIHQKGTGNSQYGTCWISNKKENKKIKKEEIIPNGWKLGRKI